MYARLGEVPSYRGTVITQDPQGLEGIGDIFRKIVGGVENVAKSAYNAAKPVVERAVTQSAVSQVSQIPGYSDVLREQEKQQARGAVSGLASIPTPYIIGGAVLLALLITRRR